MLSVAATKQMLRHRALLPAKPKAPMRVQSWTPNRKSHGPRDLGVRPSSFASIASLRFIRSWPQRSGHESMKTPKLEPSGKKLPAERSSSGSSGNALICLSFGVALRRVGEERSIVIKGSFGELRTDGCSLQAGLSGCKEFFSSEDEIYSFRFWFFS